MWTDSFKEGDLRCNIDNPDDSIVGFGESRSFKVPCIVVEALAMRMLYAFNRCSQTTIFPVFKFCPLVKQYRSPPWPCPPYSVFQSRTPMRHPRRSSRIAPWSFPE